MSKSDCLTLKGTVNGVNMILSSEADMNEILDSMREKIKSANGFFKGECDVFVSGRDLSKADKLRISSVMNTIFPEANIIFHQEITDMVPDITPRNHTNKGARFMEELLKTAEASKDALKGKNGNLKPQKIDVKKYSGSIGKGERLSVIGDLLIVGNVEADAEVECTGSMYIIGKLSGKVVCGLGGDESSHVIASGFNPQSVCICGKIIEFDEIAQECLPKMAYMLKDDICIEKIL